MASWSIGTDNTGFAGRGEEGGFAGNRCCFGEEGDIGRVDGDAAGEVPGENMFTIGFLILSQSD
jgi:hypothetical protein